MSFFTNPGKALREALDARRERERAAARRDRHQRQTLFGNRRNLHEHDHNYHHRHHHEGADQADQVSTNQRQINENKYPKWRSISAFLPSIFTTKDLDDASVANEISNQPSQAQTDLDVGLGINRQVSLSSFIGPKGNFAGETSEVNFDPSIPGMKSQLDQKAELGQISESHMSKTLRTIPSQITIPFGLPENISSEPILHSESSGNCWGLACHRYHVSDKLANNCHRQSRFLKRVMVFLSTQYYFLLVWVIMATLIPEISDFVSEYFDYSYIPLGIFIISKIFLRSMVKIRKMDRSWLLTIAVIRLICIAYYCGAVSVRSKYDVILLTGMLLFLSHMFFAITSNFVDYDVENSEIVGVACVVNIMFSILLIFPYVICKYENDQDLVDILVVNWIPSFVSSQIITMVIIFDIKQIMCGWRFPLGEADWIFTVLYV